MSKYPIGNPYNHSVQIDSDLCDYCHASPAIFMVAGRHGKYWDYICKDCWEKMNTTEMQI